MPFRMISISLNITDQIQTSEFNSVSKVTDAVFKDGSIHVFILVNDESPITKHFFLLSHINTDANLPSVIEADRNFNLIPIRAFYVYTGDDNILSAQLFYCQDVMKL